MIGRLAAQIFSEDILLTIRTNPDYLDARRQHDGRVVLWVLRRRDRDQAIEVTGRCAVTDEVNADVASYRALYKACVGAWPDLIVTGEIRFEDARQWRDE